METGQARQRHRILVCTSCKGEKPDCRPGQALIEDLRAALTGEGFEVTGVACMAGCGNPCTLAFQAEDKAFYLFGRLDPARDAPGLVEFARLYRARADGWSNSTERPASLRSKTLARIPAFTALREEKDEPVFLTAANS
ncbi:DUF1636 domain-containing protein [Denitrobaculum tricleocarpae]|uniref:DUF1636 domain-containing protein n=2 Tax=Denitrobaculum tricleocarpae TaxID=2591009 RepID=A0A545T2A0_9PROT|nr:DUF1636 domain-containing protein [Denitrobaculum tricleocarpae]